MKNLLLILVVFLLFACSGEKQRIIDAEDIIISFHPEARFTTFVSKEGTAITGTVVREYQNGAINTWQVERGLAVKQLMFYPNGQMERMLELENGEEHGRFVMYYSDGQKYVEQHYRRGEPVGTWHRWNKEGELVETIEH